MSVKRRLPENIRKNSILGGWKTPIIGLVIVIIIAFVINHKDRSNSESEINWQKEFTNSKGGSSGLDHLRRRHTSTHSGSSDSTLELLVLFACCWGAYVALRYNGTMTPTFLLENGIFLKVKLIGIEIEEGSEFTVTHYEFEYHYEDKEYKSRFERNDNYNGEIGMIEWIVINPEKPHKPMFINDMPTKVRDYVLENWIEK